MNRSSRVLVNLVSSNFVYTLCFYAVSGSWKKGALILGLVKRVCWLSGNIKAVDLAWLEGSIR